MSDGEGADVMASAAEPREAQCRLHDRGGGGRERERERVSCPLVPCVSVMQAAVGTGWVSADEPDRTGMSEDGPRGKETTPQDGRLCSGRWRGGDNRCRLWLQQMALGLALGNSVRWFLFARRD